MSEGSWCWQHYVAFVMNKRDPPNKTMSSCQYLNSFAIFLNLGAMREQALQYIEKNLTTRMSSGCFLMRCKGTAKGGERDGS